MARRSGSSVQYQGYLSEYVWRWSHRDEPAAIFLALLLRAAKPETATFRGLGDLLQVPEHRLF